MPAKYLLVILLTVFSIPFKMQTPVVPTGTIKHFEKFTSQYVSPHKIDIWLPEGYATNKKYAVLYMHDGQMLFDPAITWNHQAWHADVAMTRLLNEQRITDCIIVGIWNNGDYRHAEYFPQKVLDYLPQHVKDTVIADDLKGKPLADNYLLFITQELKPFIDSSFSTYTDAAHTFIGGSSMGGLISLYALCRYPGIFGGAICVSTHWVGSTRHQNFELFNKAFCTYVKTYLPEAGGHYIYFDYGSLTLDSLYKPYQANIDKIMAGKGYSSAHWITKEYIGDDHTENAWGRRFATPLQFMLGKR